MSAAERELLAAVLEAVDLPQAKTAGDAEVRDQILRDRMIDVRVALERAVRQGEDPAWEAAYLRARLAQKPATGYQTTGEPR